jgi:hypothetical protein
VATALAIGGMVAPVALAGTPITGDVPVNTTTDGAQEFHSIAASDGGYVVAWIDELDAVRAQRFDGSGAKAGGEILVAEGQVYSVDVAAWPDGRFVVVWHEFSSGPSDEVRARIYSAAGDPLSDIIEVNTTTAENQKYPTVSIAPDDGSFVVAWDDDSTFTLMLTARRFAATGTPITDELDLGHEGNADTQVVAQSGGSFVVAWTSADDALFRRFDGNGTGLTQAADVTGDPGNEADRPVIARGPGDTIVAAWEQLGDAYWRRFGADLTPVAGRSPAHSNLPGSQPASGIGAAADGRAVVAWEQVDESRYRRFGADGAAITEELAANADAAGGQEFPDVAVQPDGDFGIAWTDNDDGIEARFFTTPEGSGTSPSPNPNPSPPPPNPSPPLQQPLPPLDAPEFSDFVTFSSNKRCVKRINLRVKGASKITARIKGKKVATKVKPELVIKKLPQGRFKLKVTVVSKGGQTFKGARSFKRCARPKK